MNNLSVLQLFFMTTGITALLISAAFVLYLKLFAEKHAVSQRMAIRKSQNENRQVLQRNLTSVLQ